MTLTVHRVPHEVRLWRQALLAQAGFPAELADPLALAARILAPA